MSGTHEDGARIQARSALRGDPEAIRQVWETHRRWIAAVLLAHKPREVDLEDLLQDVAMIVVSRIREVRDPDALRGWLRTVAINTARAAGRTQTRRRSRRAPRSVTLTNAPAPTNPLDLGQREHAQRTLALAADLPDGYREPLLLRCVQGMSYRAIGRVMDLPETTVETRIARGRRMLRELIAQREQAASSSEPES